MNLREYVKKNKNQIIIWFLCSLMIGVSFAFMLNQYSYQEGYFNGYEIGTHYPTFNDCLRVLP